MLGVDCRDNWCGGRSFNWLEVNVFGVKGTLTELLLRTSSLGDT